MQLRITGDSLRLTGGPLVEPIALPPSETTLLATESGDTLATDTGDTLELEA